MPVLQEVQNPQYITGSSHTSRNAFMQKKLVITAVPLATHKYTLWSRLPDSSGWWEAIVVLLTLKSEWKYCEVVSALEVRHNILSFIASQKNTE